MCASDAIYKETHAGVYHFAFDANGNVTEVLNASGGIVAHYEYSPFGEVIRSSGAYADANNFRFSTKYLDTETGFCYYGYRYYDPLSGRWLSKDPLQEEGGLNLYAFVNNNGLNFTDYLGLTTCDKSWWEEAKERVENAWEKLKETTSFELGVGLGVGVKGKLGPANAQIGVDASLSGQSNINGEYQTNVSGNIGVSAGIGKHSIGANYGGSSYLGGEDGGGSSSSTVLGYKNESNGAQTSNTSVGLQATAGLVRVGASADPVAVARELFR